MKARPSQLNKDLAAGERRGVYLLHGQESFLIDDAAHRLIDALAGEEGVDFNLEIFNAAEIEAGRVVASLVQAPLLGGRRVVAVKHLEEVKADWLAELLPLLADLPSLSHLVLSAHRRIDARSKFFKATDKAGLVITFSPLSEEETADWLNRAAAERGKSLSPQAAALFLTRVGHSLADLHQELDKLVLFVGAGEAIGVEEVKAASASLRGYSIFELGPAVGRRDSLTALTILHHLLLAGEQMPAIVGLLAHRIRTLWQARALLDRGRSPAQASRELKMPPRVAREYIDQAAAFEATELMEALLALHRADLDLKSGTPIREGLEGLVLRLCGRGK